MYADSLQSKFLRLIFVVELFKLSLAWFYNTFWLLGDVRNGIQS